MCAREGVHSHKEVTPMKRVFALMLALLMLLSFVACADDGADEDEENQFDMAVSSNDLAWSPEENPNNDKIYYEYINVDEIQIIGFSGSTAPHAVTIPAEIEERKVTSIAADAFKSKTNLSAIELPDTVTFIGDMAFYGCTELKSVRIPAALVELGDAAFADCILLGTVALPETLKTLGFAAFYNCKSLTSAVLPGSITELPAQIFMNCQRLKTVSWSAAGVAIGDCAFMGCALLDTVNIPATLKSVGEYAFSGCAALTAVELPAGVKTIGMCAFNACTALGSVTFAATEGWIVSQNLDKNVDAWDAVNVSVASVAAKCLKETYCAYYWQRVQ